MAVFRWPLWLIRCRITSSRLSSGSSRLTKLARRDFAPPHHLERLPDVRRRVMETGLAGDLGVVQQRRIEGDSRVARAAAEEIHRAAAPQQAAPPVSQGSGLPTASIATSAPRSVRHLAHPPRQIRAIARIQISSSAPMRRALQLRLPPADRDHARAVDLRQPHEHQADRTQPDHRHGVAGPDAAFLPVRAARRPAARTAPRPDSSTCAGIS